jgi:uncharacterized membrane protein HdeD (DUF308 family)
MTGEDKAERLAVYLRRELKLTGEDADRRANDLLGIMGYAARPLTQRWWLFLVRGLLALIFGVLVFVQPIAALTALVLVFGVWAFIDGVSALGLAFGGAGRPWAWAIVGLIGIGIAVLTFFRPDITAVALYAAIAAWAIARGILEIALAIELRREIKGEVWLILGALASIVFGVLMIVLPTAGVLTIAWIIGVYAIVFGGLMIALAFRLRRVGVKTEERIAPVVRPEPQPT